MQVNDHQILIAADASDTLGSVAAAFTADPCNETEEEQANAALIAAAPEILEALTTCVKELKDWMKDHGEDRKTVAAIDQARAAIAKAKGETE